MSSDEEFEEGDDPNLRMCMIDRGAGGFGFNIKGTTQDGGTMSSIGGRLYPPLQYISAVDKEGAAYRGGLRMHDRIVEVNGQDVQGATHSDVVQLVVRGGNALKLKVVRISDSEALRLQRLEDEAEGIEQKRGVAPVIAAAVAKGLPIISIPSFQNVTDLDGKVYTKFNVFEDGKLRCSMRYSQLALLHSSLHKRYRHLHSFPPFPGKASNGLFKTALSKRELEVRRRKLDDYCKIVFAVEDIAKSELLKNFLNSDPATTRGAAPSASGESKSMANGARKPRRHSGALPEDTQSDTRADLTEKLTKDLSEEVEDFRFKQDGTRVAEPPFGSEAATELRNNAAAQAAGADSPPMPRASTKDGVSAAAIGGVKEEKGPSEKVKRLFDIEDDDDDLFPPKPEASVTHNTAEPKSESTTAAVKQAQAETPRPVAVAPKMDTISMLLPDGENFEVQVAPGASTVDVEHAVAEKLGLTGAAAGCVFGLFESVAGGKFERRLNEDEKPKGMALKLRKWLFAKQQEIHFEQDSTAASLIFAQTKADIAAGRVKVNPETKVVLAELAADGEMKAYMKEARKIKTYGGLTFRKCICDFPEPESKVFVSLDLSKLIIRELEGADGAEEETPFQWDIITSVERDDSNIRVTYNTDEGESETITILTRDAAYFEVAVSRIMQERGWLRMVEIGEGQTPEEMKMSRPSVYKSFFQRKAKN